VPLNSAEDVLRAVEQKGEAPRAASGPQEAARPVSLPSAAPDSDFAHKDGEPIVKQIRQEALHPSCSYTWCQLFCTELPALMWCEAFRCHW
jgi:hypothetical protein